MTERRFGQDEISAIFERAAASESLRPDMRVREDGMTLADLQSIGREVGLTPQAIADAVAALDVNRPPTTRGFLGLPLRVEHVIQLNQPLSAPDWERTVVALREVFDARGVVKSDGSLRQWTNGNLQAFLEPSGSGQRLRLRTFKGNAPSLIALGLGVAGAAAAALTAQVLAGAASTNALVGFSLITLGGVSVLAGTVLRLARWAHRRRDQMDEVARRVLAAQAVARAGTGPNALPAGAGISESAPGV